MKGKTSMSIHFVSKHNDLNDSIHSTHANPYNSTFGSINVNKHGVQVKWNLDAAQ
jgi:hypothetical protein